MIRRLRYAWRNRLDPQGRRLRRDMHELRGVDMRSPTDPWILAHLSDVTLHRLINEATGPELMGLERELRSREAWVGPAGQAVRISLAALIVSALSVLVALYSAQIKSGASQAVAKSAPTPSADLAPLHRN